MEAIKVSVVVPVYNVDEFLDNTLSDITGQTLREIEIICVDDGSTDNSEKIIQQYQEKYKNIVYYAKSNTGVADTRNFGIRQSNRRLYIICRFG